LAKEGFVPCTRLAEIDRTIEVTRGEIARQHTAFGVRLTRREAKAKLERLLAELARLKAERVRIIRLGA
jgi:hypothetical protein